jgi:hypothetical protein
MNERKMNTGIIVEYEWRVTNLFQEKGRIGRKF